ncbi:MAG: hypothetical protein ABFD51_06355 [Anaerolineaceae bacterium]
MGMPCFGRMPCVPTLLAGAGLLRRCGISQESEKKIATSGCALLAMTVGGGEMGVPRFWRMACAPMVPAGADLVRRCRTLRLLGDRVKL